MDFMNLLLVYVSILFVSYVAFGVVSAVEKAVVDVTGHNYRSLFEYLLGECQLCLTNTHVKVGMSIEGILSSKGSDSYFKF